MYSSFFMRKPLWAKKLLLALVCMMPMPMIQATIPVALEHSSEQNQPEVTQALSTKSEPKELNQQELMHRMVVNLALGGHPELSGKTFIIEPHEYKEFDVDWLVEALDRAVTSCGAWALTQKSIPVNDPEYVARNQKMVKLLVDDEQLYKKIGILLQKVKRHEAAIVSFFNNKDYLNARAQDLYFNFPLISNDWLNKNRLTLELAGVLDMGRATLQILGALCLTGIWYEWMNAADYSQEQIDADPSRAFNLARGVKEGFSGIIKNHNPFTTSKSENYQQSIAHYSSLMARGSFGDRVNAAYQGWKIGPGIIKGGSNLFAPKEWGNNLPGVLKKPVQLFAGVSAIAAALIPTVVYDYHLYQGVKGAAEKVKHVFGTMQQLRNKLAECAHGIKAIKDLSRFVQQTNELKACGLMGGMQAVLEAKNNKNLAHALNNLRSSTFMATDVINRFMYSRGKVLQTNRLLRDSAKGLIPALQGVGELDAVYAMATLVKTCSDKPNKFAFVEFVDTNNVPLIEMHNAWIPVFGIDNPVLNDVMIGGNRSTKLMLTGPNGGGKSAYLKNSIGQSLILAHSWGIVPAESARMSFFSGIASSVAAKENMKEGISTFMAEKAGMDRLSRFMTTHATMDGTYIVFADEPFRGTVNDETAYRTGLFCKELVAKSNVAGVIATHIMPVITPQEKAQFSFSHVEIIPNKEGGFVRTYKLRDGICNWWFNDQQLRRGYIDWLANLKKKQ